MAGVFGLVLFISSSWVRTVGLERELLSEQFRAALKSLCHENDFAQIRTGRLGIFVDPLSHARFSDWSSQVPESESFRARTPQALSPG